MATWLQTSNSPQFHVADITADAKDCHFGLKSDAQGDLVEFRFGSNADILTATTLRPVLGVKRTCCWRRDDVC